MKCLYCGTNELGSGDINNKCWECYNKCFNVPEANRNAVLADGCVVMDERRYLSIIANIRDKWPAPDKAELRVMEWMATEIYRKFIVMEKKATVS